MQYLVFSLWILFSFLLPAQAAERPKLPPDPDPVERARAQALFRARATDAACQRELVDARARYSESRKRLAEKLSRGDRASELDAEEERALSEWEKVLAWTEKCGPCRTLPVQKRLIPSGLRTERWYIADGYCQFPSSDAASRERAFERAADLLLHLKQYPQRNGGFDDVLEFVGVEGRSGALLPQMDKVSGSPFYSFIAVKAPELIPGISLALSYYFKNEFWRSASSAGRDFRLTFHADTKPAGFSAPDVFIVSASGKRLKARQIALKKVLGTWYVDSSGYLRYFTAAELPIDHFAASSARHTLLSTLTRMIDRMAGPR